MPSFISSSRPIAISAIAALVAYAAIIEIVRPKISFYPDQDAFNLVRAERYLLAGRPHDTVLLGSSLAVRIPDDWLPDDWLNLSFGGMGAQTGLSLLRQPGSQLPRRVLIEINTFERETEPGFETAARGPIPLAVRRLVRALRAEMRPVNVLLSAFGEARTPPLLKRVGRGIDEACTALLTSSERDAVQTDVVARQVAGGAAAEQNADGLAIAARRVGDSIRALRARGVEVLLVELPVDPGLEGRVTARRQALAVAVPDAPIVRFDPAQFQTEDGEHLAPLSARRFGCRLQARLAKPRT